MREDASKLRAAAKDPGDDARDDDAYSCSESDSAGEDGSKARFRKGRQRRNFAEALVIMAVKIQSAVSFVKTYLLCLKKKTIPWWEYVKIQSVV